MLFCGAVGFGFELGGFVIISSSTTAGKALQIWEFYVPRPGNFRELLRFRHRIRKGFGFGTPIGLKFFRLGCLTSCSQCFHGPKLR
jgi:hypothetical protein